MFSLYSEFELVDLFIIVLKVFQLTLQFWSELHGIWISRRTIQISWTLFSDQLQLLLMTDQLNLVFQVFSVFSWNMFFLFSFQLNQVFFSVCCNSFLVLPSLHIPVVKTSHCHLKCNLHWTCAKYRYKFVKSKCNGRYGQGKIMYISRKQKHNKGSGRFNQKPKF